MAHAQGFHAVYSQNGLDAWAVGDQGVAYRTLDAGMSWRSHTLGPSTLRGVMALGSTVLVVGDSGKVWRSANGGGGWSLQVFAGTPALRGVAMPTATDAWIVGDGGLALHSVDGGQSWSPQVTGTSQTLHAVRFVDASNGWAVGEGGTALSTTDAGASWNPVALPVTSALHGVDQRGAAVWIVGARGVAFASTNGGATFAPVDLKLDALSDVRAVSIAPNGAVTLAGGGGFLRTSQDGGATWTFGRHATHGPMAAVHVVGTAGFAVSNRHHVPLATADGGASWTMPSGATVSRFWKHKLPSMAFIRGNSISWNAVDPKTIYVALGGTVFRSQDEGETWSTLASIPGSAKVNAFMVSPADTNLFLAAVIVSQRQVMRSADHGATWTTTLVRPFGEFGIPLEYDPDHPDTVFFGADNDALYRSFDFGLTWHSWGSTTFRSPCDIVVIPDSSNILVLGDGVTGSGRAKYFQSLDGGATWTETNTRPTGTSEIPGLATSRLRNHAVFGTNWSGGGVQRSLDYGATWPNVATTGITWGIDVARDDPNVVVYGTYAGGRAYLSVDGGDTFVSDTMSSTNYSFFARDRAVILALESNGIRKLEFVHAYTPLSGLADVAAAPPVPFVLGPARPNPSSRETRIAFRLPAAAAVELDVFDLQGHRVATLARGRMDAGAHEATLRWAAVGRGRAGVYFCRLRAGTLTATHKLLLLK